MILNISNRNVKSLTVLYRGYGQELFEIFCKTHKYSIFQFFLQMLRRSISQPGRGINIDFRQFLN